MRRAIAEHMRRSLDTSAHVTNVSEVDFTRIAEIRRGLKPEFERQGVNLTFLAFVARAVVDSIADWPWMNAELRGESIITRSHVNLGIAVALEGGKGLIVPVIRNAQDLNLLGTARAIQDVAQRAREKKLLPDDVQGGTITITNPGGYGTLFGTPVISQPQVANIGVYAIVKRPVVVTDDLGHDSLAIRHMMFLSVTYDHRLVDGAYAAQFARDLKQRLEGWDASPASQA
jgi:2-oxoglutarate dehydrogenase E2 component (dihydrolipoamide succinyltransferase)